MKETLETCLNSLLDLSYYFSMITFYSISQWYCELTVMCLNVSCDHLLADWSLARLLEESKLWLLRRDDGEDWNEVKVVWLAGATILVTLGTDNMLGARIRFGMLFRSMSKSTKHIHWDSFTIKCTKNLNLNMNLYAIIPHLLYLIKDELIHPTNTGINR